jgi:hypothetical protein
VPIDDAERLRSVPLLEHAVKDEAAIMTTAQIPNTRVCVMEIA